MPDDIRTDHPVSQTERKPDLPPDTDEAAAPQHRQVGPESEVSGGSEAPPTDKKTYYEDAPLRRW